MKKRDIQDIIECLPKGRTKFYYFRDRYALMLLSYWIGKGMTLRELKSSRFNRLVQKPVVQKILSRTGDGKLTANALNAYWPKDYHCYLLTLGMWGDRERWARYYNQTSRPGRNLVLQLNFTRRHNVAHDRLLKPRPPAPFHCTAHPVAVDGQYTLAWARIDLEMDMDEALIEEIQTDWIRRALWSRQVVTSLENRANMDRRYVPAYVRRLECTSAALSQYLDIILKPHIRLWAEAMLAAAIWFLRKEIGIRRIYYHTFESGCHLKRITGRKPPRSLYTKLPDSFCFRRTTRRPELLTKGNNRKMVQYVKHHHPVFYLLEFQ